MKKLITTLSLLTFTTLGVASVVWAEHANTHDGKHHDKHHFGKMMFKKMDANEDGAISTREHEAGLQKMMERRRSHFAKMDQNSDGLLTKEEMREAHKEMGEKWREQKE